MNVQYEFPWYVIYTIPRNEKKVYNELEKKNIPAFLPLQPTIRKWGKKTKKVELPLFPNYVFVQVPDKRFWNVLNIKGVTRFLIYNNSPAFVKESDIEMIKKLLENNGEVVETNNYIPGEKVRVKLGLFSGLEGEVIDIKGKKKLIVLFKSINKIISVEIPVEFLEKRMTM